ncbi:type VI secretion system baseplate subunit TssF (plasmid) [Hafnia alvei]|uniref:type VI secretion system baseplate subunit TssF n=1 Tax=Hafnia alvei TaxID=569 RepID=UPI000B723941|nr:type VI secretion system baseplate subunit TssF [Hafnia alvei]MBI0278603.1 type VI secretion system baseplate subunit TssF [Hafnia alvei]PNL03898.1 type VI secretion system baseplate subunit TssF [Hafnia alvei]
MLAKKLISYYQNELAYLKTQSKVFARLFPKVARRLGMSEGMSEDPHIERVIESFALVTAQIQLRLDEDMPEVTEALLTVLAPQLLRPFPSVCIVQMSPDSKVSALTASNLIKAGTSLFSRPVNGQTCRFRTVYPVTLHPLSLHTASLHFNDDSLNWSLKIRLTVWVGATLSADSLRIHLSGSNTIANILYTLLCCEVQSLFLLHNDIQHSLSPQTIHAVGFAEGENLLGGDSRMPPTHSLLQDYFFFPQKFHFIDMPLPEGFVADSQSELTLLVVFNRCILARQLEDIASMINENMFLLNCTPAVNLFTHRAEPISPSHANAEYPVMPDLRQQHAMDVWSVDSVAAMRKQGNDTFKRPIYPLFGLDHSAQDGEVGLFWQCVHRETVVGDGAISQLFIAFSDRGERPLVPQSDIISLSLTCTNREVPAGMRNGDPDGDFESELPIAGMKIIALTRPTLPVRPPAKKNARWRLISQLSLNHMLIGGSEGARILKETLALYNFNDNPTIGYLINLILQVESSPVVSRLVPQDPLSMARGIEIRIIFADEAAEEVEYFLLCRFIDCFLALYAPVNSFTKVITSVANREEMTRIWPIRAGRLAWI